MKHWNAITKTGAAATVALLVGLPANAMTCEEFTAMSAENQQGYIMGLDAGRTEAREMARGDAPDSQGEGVSVKEDESTDGGREEARDEANSAPDMYVQVVEDCTASPGMTVTEAFPMADPQGKGG
ncbi:hypothetical protein [Roseovarius indicus]|uniref:Uncharacterized protein n=1 Tax=Roseovarius indicus TaxID=540747 RepID=A0A0T5PD91_9RHOB|nr:hypothetical protein [Roseovarius indicus]KRS19109.1 hypothetical protein XM52_05470 [Roseovarius indicus]QEW25937.1 hypothetical protein RIdsm_01729 [Roseovarius indicus]SFD90617.1 hypothetical protein SAMN04488031_103142 [Roseovarius indicus]